MSIDFTKWRVDQIRTELVKLTGMNPDDAAQIKGKSELVEKLMAARIRLGLDSPNVLDDVELEESSLVNTSLLDNYDEEEESNEEKVAAPKIGGPDWQEYVLSLLNPDEYVVNRDMKCPKASGLRRVAQIVLGPIVESGPDQVWLVPGQATITYRIKFLWQNGFNTTWMSEADLARFGSSSLNYRTFSEIADSNKDNTPSPFNLHLSATASSRAEGRALRKALQLNIVTAEEMSLALTENTLSSEPDYAKEPITSSQVVMLQSLAKRIKINLEKALQFHNFPSDLASLTREQAAEFAQRVNSYQGDGKDSLEIPEFIKEVENV